MQKAIIIISVLFLVGCQNQSEEKNRKEVIRIADSLKNAGKTISSTEYDPIKVTQSVPELSSSQIWECFHAGKEFDNSGRLISKKNAETESRTEIAHKYLYQDHGSIFQAVVLTTNGYTNGIKDDCHACSTDVGVMNFVYQESLNRWEKESYSEQSIPQEGYGIPPPLQLKAYKGKACLYVIYQGDNGSGSTGNPSTTYKYYFDIKTLKEIH